MFVIVHNNSVILGPMRWNRFRFENEIQEECEVSCTLPDRNDDLDPIVVSNEIKILPILGTENPEYNPKIEILHGPFWEFTDTQAIYHYEVVPMNIDSAKNMLKEQVTAERWNKENAGVNVTLNGTEYTFKTDKETRAILHNAVSNMESINWKQDQETWIQMTNGDTQTVLTAILTHVQACFDWEFNKFQEIDACNTLEMLDAVVIVDQKETGVM